MARPKLALTRSSCLVAAGIVLLALGLNPACTADFDKFSVVDDGTNTGGVLGATGAFPGVTGGSGSTTGGQPGLGGSGGTPSGGSGGTSGTGGIEGCQGGQKECPDATCAPVTDPAKGCAAIGTCDPCLLDNATPSCDGAGMCAVGSCEQGWGNCDLSAENGCEQPTVDLIAHCGACNRACAADNVASKACTGESCTPSCALGFADCSPGTATVDDGCETNSASDAQNCGGCDNACDNGFSCVGMRCVCTNPNQCRNGPPAQCNDVEGVCVCSNGTCRQGETCTGQDCTCNGGAACTGADEVCCQAPAGCRNLMTAADSCGACGRACTAGFVCTAGTCECDADADCNAGSAGVCSNGLCTCGVNVCTEGQRCLADGSCG